MNDSCITLTFGDCAENHVGMQQLGNKDLHGYSYNDIVNMTKQFPNHVVDIYKLHELGDNFPEAYVAVVRNAIANHEKLFNTLTNLDWDKKALMRKRVVNKQARYNLCFDDFNQEPDYENGKGRIVKISDVPELQELYTKIENIADGYKFKVEGNFYYDVTKNGIGFHGDSERSKVIGIRLGATIPLVFKWYKNFEAVSQPLTIQLNSGDMYIMSEKAVGTDWKRKKVPTLRHAAGCKKYCT
jgi:alkylated DNA repair dioxygenase AlkB